MRPRALLGPAPQEADGPVCTPPHDQEPRKGLPCPPAVWSQCLWPPLLSSGLLLGVLRGSSIDPGLAMIV